MSDNDQSKGAYELPEPTNRDIFSVAWHRLIRRRLNALMRLVPQRGAQDGSLIMTDGNCLLPLSNSGLASGAGTGTISDITSADASVTITNPTGPTADLSVGPAVKYRGLYSAATNYKVNDLVYTSPSGSRFGWICETANGPGTSVHAPTWPESGTIYWRAITNPGNIQLLTVVQTWGDYIECQDSLFNTILVAKPPFLRFSNTTRVINGNTFNYGSYGPNPASGTTDQTRTVTSSTFGGSIVESTHYGYHTGDKINAQTADHTGVIVSSVELTLIDTNVDGREWVMEYGQ